MLRHLLGWTKPARYAADSLLFNARNKSNALEPLKDKFKGQPLLVVGNGPSLNKTPLDDFAHIPSIGMNKIDLIFPRVTWRPSVIVCINNMVVKQHADVFAASDIPVYLGWKSRWFAPRSPSINYFNMTLAEDFSTDFSTHVGSAATVTYPALQLAHYMGADPVIVVGVDHSFNKTGKDHAYEKREGDDVNHFDPNYFKAGTYWGLPNLDASERVYWRARQAFEESGRRIVDATIGGKLEVFEKVSIEEAVRMAS
ncbi:hypothetical protein [Pyruvatibacter sp.]|uniref:hypothetical protein n=1 Tax=Pyruvatibacter sp. TaxID=1981328 RepID=UPI003267C88E